VPALPWTTVSTVEPDTSLTVMASTLPLRSYVRIPRFLLWTMRIRAQLARSPGLFGYALDAQLLRKTFWTVSAWTGPPELGRFNRADPHAAAVAAIRPGMRPTTFVTWTCTAGDLPIRWPEARERLASARPHER
jgi:hypothetical protein